LNHNVVPDRPKIQPSENIAVSQALARLRPVDKSKPDVTSSKGTRTENENGNGNGNKNPQCPFGPIVQSRPIIQSTEMVEKLYNETEFEKIRNLGVSRISQTRHLRCLTTKRDYVVKEFPSIPNFNRSMGISFLKAIDEKDELSHRFLQSVVKFKAPVKDQSFVVCSELCTNGSLADIIIKDEEPIWWNNTMKTITILGICEVLGWLHVHHRVHGNIRPSNILFDDKLNPKLSEFFYDDFRRARLINHVTTGIISYDAPENKNGKFNEQSDVFSWALTAIVVLTKNEHIISTRTEFRPPKWTVPGLNQRIQKLINRCFDGSPDRRPTCAQILTEFEAIDYAILPDVDVEVVRNFVMG
jgi:serine/threonine protein kinase